MVDLWFGVFLAVILTVLSVIDVRELRLPDPLTAALASGGLLHSIVAGRPDLTLALVSATFGGVLMAGVALAYRRLRGIDGLGFGDLKLFAAGMTWLQPSWLGIVLLVASLSAITAILLLSRMGVMERTDRLPFGPFLALGLFVGWCLQTVGY